MKIRPQVKPASRGADEGWAVLSTLISGFVVFGGIGWVTGLSVLGYFLGGVPWIGKNLDKTILAIIFISLLPAIITFLKARAESKKKKAGEAAP